MSFHQKFPEKFAPDESASHPPLPVYFSNVCLRFLPVLDVVIHRFIEMQHVHQIAEVILDHLSILYKFHGKTAKPLIFRLKFHCKHTHFQIVPLHIYTTHYTSMNGF